MVPEGSVSSPPQRADGRKRRWDIKQHFCVVKLRQNFATSAHWLAVVPARVARVDALNGPWPLLHDKARGAAEGHGGAQLIGDVAAAEIPVGDVRLPAVLIIEGLARGNERVATFYIFAFLTTLLTHAQRTGAEAEGVFKH